MYIYNPLGIDIIQWIKVVEEKEEKALKQLKEKEYHTKYLNLDKEIYLVGIEFCKKNKNVCNFEWERVK